MEKSKKQISFLITHYNRPAALKSCIESIKNLSLSNYEIVVSDDASAPEIQQIIQEFFIDTVVIAAENLGLGANLNKGIRACKGEYILYCQEDFVLNSDFKIILPNVWKYYKAKKQI
jgi:glycosyltransferase involved in cell wall biosynthesis